MEVCDSHTWSKRGIYTISVVVKDEHGATITAYTEVNIPRNKALSTRNPILNWLLEQFLHSFQIIRYILEM